ncbi:hypothetical protein Tco_0863257 [Tanacetum coccineum]
MSTNGQTPLSQPTSVVRNTLGKEPVLQDSGMPISDEAFAPGEGATGKAKGSKSSSQLRGDLTSLKVRNTHQKKGFEGKARTKACLQQIRKHRAKTWPLRVN